MTTARALWITGPKQAELRDIQLRERQNDEVLVRSLYSAISRGSESLVFEGRVPSSQYALMRAPYQEGDFPFPVKYGYISVGEVVEGADDLIGQKIFTLFGHQDFYNFPAAKLALLPAQVPAERAVLAANMETALNALWDSEGLGARQCLIIGAGTLGFLIAFLAQQRGYDVLLCDIDSDKGAVAEKMGLPFALPEAVGEDFPLIFHCSASAQGAAFALSRAAFEGTILELSWFGDREIGLPLGEDFHSKRLTYRSSQVGQVAQNRRNSHDQRARLCEALTLLKEERLNHLITGESPFEDLPQTLERLAAAPKGVLCHRITYA